jgi:hypothetical protein
MKKLLRVALAIAVLASLAPIALAMGAPTGGVPQPQVTEVVSGTTSLTPWWSALIAAILSWLGL